jgi:hypothetical protein
MSANAPSSSRRRNSANSIFEPLETRQLMAANALVSGGVLRVDGTDSADRILVEAVTRTIATSEVGSRVPGANPNGTVIQAHQFHVKITDAAGVVRTAPNGLPLDTYFDRDGITRIDVYAAAGSDNVDTHATSVSNKVYLGSGLDVANTGFANDSVYGEAGNDSATLGTGNDYFSGGTGNDSALGGAGNDRLYGNNDRDELNGEAGNDTVDGGDHNDDLSGGTGNDSIEGGTGNDSISGGSGNDSITGESGNDTAHGNDGNDLIRGEAGDDDLFGSDGRDTIYGGGGADSISGGDNNDLLVAVGGGQSDTVKGNDGTDIFWVDSEGSESVTSGSAENVHRIASFKELRKHHSSGPDTVQSVDRGLDGPELIDPISVGSYRDFSDHKLFAEAGITESDANQQHSEAHDCYFISTLMAIAKHDPNFIARNVVDLGDGTYAVHFHNFFGDEYVRVDGDLPTNDNGSMTYARLGAEGSIWAAIMEKAYAFYRRDEGNYLSLDYGSASEVLDDLGLGGNKDTFNPFFFDARGLANRIREELQAGRAVLVSTTEDAKDHVDGLRNNHILLVDHVVVSSSTGEVTKIVLHDPRNRVVELTPDQAKIATDGYTSALV